MPARSMVYTGLPIMHTTWSALAYMDVGASRWRRGLSAATARRLTTASHNAGQVTWLRQKYIASCHIRF